LSSSSAPPTPTGTAGSARGALAAAAQARGAHGSAEAVERAVAGLAGTPPSLVMAFPAGDLDPGEQLRQARAAAAGAPVVGMTAGAVLGPEGPLDWGASAIAFGADVAIGTGVARRASRDLGAAGRRATVEALRAAGDRADGYLLLVLLLDTASGDQAEAIAGAYEAAGAETPLVGGAAGGGNPAQLAGGEAARDSVVAVALRSDRPIGVGHAHGCSPCASPAVVTRGKGRTIERLDGRPAQEVYLEKLGRAGERPSDAAFAGMANVHPLAQPELRGDVRLRHVLGRAPDGGLVCATPIPVNAAVEFTEQSPEAIVKSTWSAVSDALAPLNGAVPRAALVFDCAGRLNALGGPGPHLEAEAAALRDSFGTVSPPLAGLYTRGEVGRVRGAKGDRNHAIVVAALA